MKITKIISSRIDSVDFSNLPFGRIFSDHMLRAEFNLGSWGELEIIPYGPISFNPSLQALHYGQSIFEGMKAFKNKDNELLLFRKEENLKRMNRSAERLSIPKIPEFFFTEGLEKLLSIDNNWCSSKDGYSLYIRPFIFASSDCIKASSSDKFTFIVITSPTFNYYNGEINLIIEQKYTRASKGGVGFTKAAGNYASSFYPTKLANSKGFQQVIWTDSYHHNYIEECGTMNIWFRIGDSLYTPEISDTILEGITRDSVIRIASDSGIKVYEEKISIENIIQAYKSGELLEVFGSGTAVSISPISSITFNDFTMKFNNNDNSYANTFKAKLQNIQRGIDEDKYSWVSKIKG